MTVRSGCSTVLQIELAGVATDVLVNFDVEDYSSEDPETGGGSPAEVSILSVHYSDDNGEPTSDRDIAEVLKGLRDLEVRTFTRYPRIDYLGRTITLYGTPITEPRYGEGFNVHYSFRNWRGERSGPWISFNERRTVYDRLYADLVDYVHSNEHDWIESDEFDFNDC